ncbi:MAG: hypothetical protein A2898_04360 [Candidatus Kerfeldbacteria bacterium RIFCSPLOWO2_01_FULL_48_11]|uniref:Uncharacterized protein n=1 Tax=Candidatus Kerfeldbacteria bacterium RIFCSPLOWO2_01_FULL_48_11 TaxID=1798543 RepID=A0A1G2B291_9BACT|nr:MAG: hypothetical protein A2898_04360 [Candidatus Kerfeldbacteria bacterium RIFCSPLOWO2_01_FULL_48_11]HCJ52475.1 hypothetical protein [Candidatus Kerfeldbacteria bacterium]HCM68577.1 hypothetical protein [Candidatus Kerfeldbacteria bacterium]
MLITIGVLVTLVTLLGPLFINFSRTARDSRVKQELLFEASTIAKRISDTVLPSSRIVQSKSILSQPYLTGSTTVILEALAIDGDGSIIPNTYDYMVLTLDPLDTTKMLRVTDADDTSSRTDRTEVLGSHIEDLTFTYTDTDPENSYDVASTFTISTIAGQRTLTHTLQTHARLRNK